MASVGTGRRWSSSTAGVRFGDRPPWDWALGFAREMLPVSKGIEMLQAMRSDLLTNMVTNPVGILRAPLRPRAPPRSPTCSGRRAFPAGALVHCCAMRHRCGS
jgi:hypothetical protein